MTNIFSVFSTRTSSREFLNKSINREIIEQIIAIGKSGPVSGGLDCVVIKEIFEEEEIRKLFIASYYQDVIKNSKVILLVGSNDNIILERYLKAQSYWFSCQNATIAAQNIIIASHILGIKSCFVGSFRKEKIVNLLGNNVTPWVIICLGY